MPMYVQEYVYTWASVLNSVLSSLLSLRLSCLCTVLQLAGSGALRQSPVSISHLPAYVHACVCVFATTAEAWVVRLLQLEVLPAEQSPWAVGHFLRPGDQDHLKEMKDRNKTWRQCING